ncbi:MAG: exodeoxyribonuclease VII small subunit [Verrucomicrobia bacterium]|nr:exodeoxyribonuclease VII small subunit [Verrucomicrobiota bacterium]NDF16739.1 exodeoxyribonuclease VII small subunit [Verrucomicrobiota bacterium]
MAKTGKSGGEGSFEESLQHLEKLVEQMESPELPLETIVEKYESGMKLVAVCTEKLKAAEKRISLLTRRKDGSLEEGELEDQDSAAKGKKAGRTAPDLLT